MSFVALFKLKNDLIKHTKFVYIQKHFFFNRNGKCNWYQNRFEYILVSHPFLPARILWCLLHFKSQDPFKHNKKEGDTRNYFCIMYGCVTLRLKPAYFQSDTSFSNAQNGTYLFFEKATKNGGTKRGQRTKLNFYADFDSQWVRWIILMLYVVNVAMSKRQYPRFCACFLCTQYL